jgi:hypothetical protein
MTLISGDQTRGRTTYFRKIKRNGEYQFRSEKGEQNRIAVGQSRVYAAPLLGVFLTNLKESIKQSSEPRPKRIRLDDKHRALIEWLECGEEEHAAERAEIRKSSRRVRVRPLEVYLLS